jgi:hypothetical protein
MAIPVLSDEELNQLEDGLPVLIDDPGEILRAMKQAGMQRGILKVPADVPQMWHQAVRYAAVHGRLPLLLIRVHAQLVGRTDADSVLQLISVAIERNVSVVLTEEVRKIQSQADQLLGEHDPNIAVRAALHQLRLPVRHIQQQLDNEKFWPTLFPGLTAEEAHAARGLLFDRCLDALRTIDALVGLSKLAGATPSSAADDRDRWRLEHVQSLAILDAKFAVVKALRSLHEELTRCLPVPTEDSGGI